MSPTFRAKPVVIEAAMWLGTALDATPIINWILACGGTATYHEHLMDGDLIAHPDPYLRIQPPNAAAFTAATGDWIIRDVGGRFSRCKPDTFAATYDAADAT